eukprot:2295067-Alexandrium_andersonii.AAC.1
MVPDFPNQACGSPDVWGTRAQRSLFYVNWSERVKSGFRAPAPGAQPNIKKFTRFMDLRGFPPREDGEYQPSVADFFGYPHPTTGPDGAD